jgi:UDP-3-O-[3-hydroxymyristoyl] glucosamine N-acyltransferase
LPDIAVGKGLHADATAIIGYRSSRAGPTDLVLGADAVIRSGTMIYLGSRIGARFQAGHNVVVREECEIGDDVSVWSNSVIDYGCRIGDRVKIHSNCYVAQFSEIADGAFLAPGVTIANDLYPGQASSAAVMSGPSIGAGAQIGVNATILPAFGNPATVRGEVRGLQAIEDRVDAVATSVSRYRLVAGVPGGSAAGMGPR